MGAADTVLLLKKVNRGTDTTFLYLTGRDIEFRAMAIEFTDCYWRLDEDVPPHDGICYRPLAPIVKTVCEYIKEHKHFRLYVYLLEREAERADEKSFNRSI